MGDACAVVAVEARRPKDFLELLWEQNPAAAVFVEGARSDASLLGKLHYFVDVFCSIIIAILSGIQPGETTPCKILAALALLVSIAYVLYYILLFPLQSRIDMAFAIAMGINQCVICLFAVIGYNSSTWTSKAFDWAVTIQTFGIFVQAVLGLAYETFKWFRNHQTKRRHSNEEKESEVAAALLQPPQLETGVGLAPSQVQYNPLLQANKTS